MKMTAKDLLENHKVYKMKLLYLEQAECDDDELLARALKRTPYDGMPRTSSLSNPTEKIALELAEQHKEYAQKRKKLEQYILLYEALFATFDEKGKWFIHQHYNEKKSLRTLITQPNSLFLDYNYSSIWRYKKKLLEDAEKTLCLDEI